LTETGTDHVISALLSFGIDGGVDRQTTLSNSSRVLIFKFLANVLDWIIKRRRLRLRLVVSRVGKLNWFGFGRIDFSAFGPTSSAAAKQAFLDSFLVATRTLRPRRIRLGLRLDF